MIKDFVRDGHAYLRCDQCGAETPIIKLFAGIGTYNIDRTLCISHLEVFHNQHILCKHLGIQLEIETTK